MWAAGCVMAELLLRRAIFPGRPDDDVSQLSEIVRLCGSPNPSEWPVRDPWS